MELAVLLVMLLCVMALAGLVVYFIVDYQKYRKDVDKRFGTSDGKLSTEQVDRMSNVKYVVDQVNNVNNDIYTQVTSNVTKIDTAINNQAQMLGSFASFLSFSSNTPASTSGAQVSLMNLPGSGNIDVNLMQRVNATMGLTAKDLSAQKNVKFCSQLDPTRCIQIPDANGNLYLTSMQNNASSSIIMDASNVNSTGTINAPQYKLGGSMISTNPQGLNIIGSNLVQIGAITSPSTVSLGDAIVVDPTGAIRFNSPNGTVGTISKNANSIIVQSSNVIIQGDLELRGKMYKADVTGMTRTLVTLP